MFPAFGRDSESRPKTFPSEAAARGLSGGMLRNTDRSTQNERSVSELLLAASPLPAEIFEMMPRFDHPVFRFYKSPLYC